MVSVVSVPCSPYISKNTSSASGLLLHHPAGGYSSNGLKRKADES